MTVKLLTEHHLEILTLKEAAQTCLNLHLSKCHIVGNHMSRPKCMLSKYNNSCITTVMLTKSRVTHNIVMHIDHNSTQFASSFIKHYFISRLLSNINNQGQ